MNARERAKRQRDAFQQEVERLGMFRMLVEDAAHVVLVLSDDITANVLYANSALARHLHVQASSVVGRYVPHNSNIVAAIKFQPFGLILTPVSLCVPGHLWRGCTGMTYHRCGEFLAPSSLQEVPTDSASVCACAPPMKASTSASTHTSATERRAFTAHYGQRASKFILRSRFLGRVTKVAFDLLLCNTCVAP